MPSRISNPTLVGRSEELAALVESVRRAAERQCSVVLLKGDAGIGKTRLVQELERAPECRETLRLRGACVDFGGEDLAYAPIVAALRTAPTEVLLNAARSLPPVMGAELARLTTSPTGTRRAAPRVASTSTCSSSSEGLETRRPSCSYWKTSTGPTSRRLTFSPSWLGTAGASASR